MKISEFLSTVVERIPKSKEGDSTLNPVNYFKKLVESHGYSHESEAVDFFKSLKENKGFFEDQNMPSTWSKRTYAAAAQGLFAVVDNEKTRELLKDIGIEAESLLEELVKKKRHFMSAYKKDKRMEAKAAHQGKKDETSTSDNDNDEDAPHQIVLSEPAPAEHDLETSSSSVLSVMCDNAELISIHRVRSQVSHAVSMLEKYMKHETDEFKVVFLEVIKDTLLRVGSGPH